MFGFASIYIYIHCFFERMAKKAPEIFAESFHNWGDPGVFGTCTAMALLCRWEDDDSSGMVGRLEEGNQFQKIPICYLCSCP